MARWPWSRPDVSDLARAVVARLDADGRLMLPAGARAETEAQVRARAEMAPSRDLAVLPRDPFDASVPFGPGTPLRPAPLDPLVDGVIPPRRWQYPISVNLQLTAERHVPWSVLKAVAEQCDVVRHCIEIRKQGLIARQWDITLRPRVIAQVMAETGIKSRSKAAALARDQYGPEMERIARFLERPYPGQSWSQWANAALEQHYVYDALTIWPERNLKGDCIGWKIIDGSTIKPLWNHLGDVPSPPAPAFQQILYGFPRGEFTQSDHPDAEMGATELFYRPRNLRVDSPYGYPATEMAIPAADLWLKRQAWMRGEYTDGATPRMGIKVNNKDEWTPAQLAAWDRVYNGRLSGQTAERQRAQLFPNGFDPVIYPNLDERYKADYDEAIRKWIASIFGVMPTQIGVIPNQGIGGRGQFEGEQNQTETMTQRPLEEWFVDTVNELAVATQHMSPDLTLNFTGNELDEEALLRAQRQAQQTASAQRTVNDIRSENGEDLFDFPEADMPFISTPAGPVFLQGASARPDAPAPGGAGGELSKDGTDPGEASPAQGGTDAVGDELRAFARFARGRRGRGWRDFAFVATPVELATACNRLAGTGSLDAAIALARAPGAASPKAGTPPPEGTAGLPPTVAAGDALALTQAPLITEALQAGWDIGAAVRAAQAVASAQMDADALAIVAQGAVAPLAPDPAVLTLTVERIWGAAWSAEAPKTPAAAIAWGTWEPGDALAARLIQDTPGLPDLLAESGIVIQGIERTTVERVGDALADGLRAGEGSSALADRVAAVLGDRSRALMIARTEAARAMERASALRAMAEGQTQKRWIALPGACSICHADAEAGWIALAASFPGGASQPPQHPWCRCTTAYRTR